MDVSVSKASKDIDLNAENLATRRLLEVTAMKKFDKTMIDPRKEFWVLMDSQWLYKWASFVEGKEGAELPGKISTFPLLDENSLEPIYGLEAKIHYRGVPPMVYYILRELHGKDKSPELFRYKVDIYLAPVPPEQLAKLQPLFMTEARIFAHRMREQWTTWELEDDEVIVDDHNICCGLTREHIESIMYWMIRCCSRSKSGRKDISYRNYKPLSNQEEEYDDANNEKDSDQNDSEASAKDSVDLEKRYWSNGTLFNPILRRLNLL